MAALYSDILLDHFRNPRNYGDFDSPDVSCENFNPLCGDRIRIELKIDAATIAAARFKGDGCAISIAAASLLTEMITGSSIAEITELTDDRIITALQSDIQPARIQCATLALEALRAALKTL
jgi:nitrogen fixation protein NifU and related proteins